MRSQNLTIVACCKCRRIQVKGSWIEEPPFLSPYVRKTHTYCPTCLAAEMEHIESLVFGDAPVGIASATISPIPAHAAGPSGRR